MQEGDWHKALRCLDDGLAADETVPQALGMPEGSADLDVARALVQVTSAGGIAQVQLAEAATNLADSVAPAEASQDGTLLGQLDGEGSRAIRLDEVEDAPTLLAILRGGSLPQRRRALGVLAGRLERNELSGEVRRSVLKALEGTGDVELEYELHHVRERLPGGAGRKARSESEDWRREVEVVERHVQGFWDAVEGGEPFSALAGDRRPRLLLRTRDLPDSLVRHLCAVLEGEDGVSGRDARIELLAGLRYAGDPRLVPTLVALLDSGSTAIVEEAARVLRRVDDPRVLPALQEAYERTVVAALRLRLAEALGGHGDSRGVDYVRSQLEGEDPGTLRAALAALDTVGGPEDTEALLAFLEHEDSEVAAATVWTLGRIGDGRALAALVMMRRRVEVPALLGSIEAAEASIRARMELRGEEPELPEEVEEALAVRETMAPKAMPQSSEGKRWAAWRHYLAGVTWVAFGMLRRGVNRLEVAAELRPGWAKPHLAQAMVHHRKERYAQALKAFRRAIEVDRPQLERQPMVIRAAARTFLRRSEQVEGEGRKDVALGLVQEVLGLDLRRAPSALRFELQRRHDALRRER